MDREVALCERHSALCQNVYGFVRLFSLSVKVKSGLPIFVGLTEYTTNILHGLSNVDIESAFAEQTLVDELLFYYRKYTVCRRQIETIWT